MVTGEKNIFLKYYNKKKECIPKEHFEALTADLRDYYIKRGKKHVMASVIISINKMLEEI